MVSSKHLALALALFALAACSKAEQEPAQTMSPPPAAEQPQAGAAVGGADTAAIDAAVANSNRTAADREEDARRKAPQVLEFLGARPGMHVIDYLSAGGYYSELLSYVVGPQGKVIAYNNPPYLKYSGDAPAKRYGNDRLPNVEQVTAKPEEAPFEPNSVDAVLFVQSYHDLHWRAKKPEEWPAADPAKSLERVAQAMKPGAVAVVIDHVATAGSDPAKDVDTLHRIDPAIIKRDFEAAGLKFDAESPVFANPADDHTKPVFDPSIRYKSDQVMYRFRKEADRG
jgi:predicted methyltransferase